MNQEQEIEKKERNVELRDRGKDREYGDLDIDIFELLSYYMTKLKWLIAAFLLGALIAGLYTHYMITPLYTATSKMYMVSSSSQSVVDLTDLNLGQSISNDYVELLKTRPIIESVIKEQDLSYSYGTLVNMINLTLISNTRIIKIDATSADPEEAMNIANALAEKGVTELPKLMETPEPNIAEYAIVPINKSSPNLTKNTMIGGLIGLVIMLVIFTIPFLLDDTFRTAEDIQKEFGVMPLTVIPEGKIEGAEPEGSKGRSRSHRRKRSKKSKGGKA